MMITWEKWHCTLIRRGLKILSLVNHFTDITLGSGQWPAFKVISWIYFTHSLWMPDPVLSECFNYPNDIIFEIQLTSDVCLASIMCFIWYDRGQEHIKCQFNLKDIMSLGYSDKTGLGIFELWRKYLQEITIKAGCCPDPRVICFHKDLFIDLCGYSHILLQYCNNNILTQANSRIGLYKNSIL